MLNESNEIFEEKIMSDEDVNTKIILSLIKNNTSDNDYISFNLKEELQFDSINNTKKTIEKIFKIINLNEEYIDKNKIKSIKDLLDSKKVNFYYLLLKYIFTDSIYICNIPFLLEARKFIIKTIKNKINDLSQLFKNENIDKIEYVIKRLSDSEYYISKFNNFKKLIEILKYYNYYHFTTKREEIKLLGKIIEQKEVIDSKYDYLLKDYDKANKDNKYIFLLNHLYFGDKKDKNNENIISEKTISEKKEYLKKYILTKKFYKLRPNDKKKLVEFFIDENKEEISKRYNKDLYDFYFEKIKKKVMIIIHLIYPILKKSF